MSYANIVKSVTGSIFRHDENNASSARTNAIKGTLVAGAVVSVGWVACKLTPIIWQQLKNLVGSRPEAQNIIDAVNENTNAANVPQQDGIPRSPFGQVVEETLNRKILTLDFVNEISRRRGEFLQNEWDILSPRILNAPVKSRHSALHIALVNGYTSTIKDIIQLLIQCSENTRNQVIAQMIGVRNEGEESALRQAIRNGRSSAIIAYSRTLEALPPDMRNTPLQRALKDCESCLDDALASGSAFMMSAYASLAQWLPCYMRDKLLSNTLIRTNNQGQIRLESILLEANAATMIAFSSLAALTSPYLRDAIAYAPLAARAKNGELRLQMMLREQGEGITSALASLLKLISPDLCDTIMTDIENNIVSRIRENKNKINRDELNAFNKLKKLLND